MSKRYLSNSVRKFLRREKARIRREVFNSVEAEKKIKELVEKISATYNKDKGQKE